MLLWVQQQHPQPSHQHQQQGHRPGLLRTTSELHGMYANHMAYANTHAMAMVGHSSESAAAMPRVDLLRHPLHATTTSSEAVHAAGNHLMAHLSSQAHQQLQQQQVGGMICRFLATFLDQAIRERRGKAVGVCQAGRAV